MSIPSLPELIDQVDTVLPVPSVAMQVVKLLDQPDSNVRDVADVLAQDQGLTANVLKLANSAYYGMPRRVSLPVEAVALLGFKTVRSIVWSSVMEVLYNKPLVGYKLESGALWEHSLAAAVIGKYLANSFKLKDPESFYVSGLLHDVGKLVLNIYLPVEFGKVIGLVEHGKTFSEAEKEVLGYDHAEIGGLICDKWHLPENIVDGVRYHHSPQEGSESARITHLSNAMALMMGYGSMGAASMASSFDESVLYSFVSSEEEWLDILDKAEEQVLLAMHATAF
ncbi:HDOD domain-containing protein [Coprothermobacter platensis]|uniref:HDOD domain-containing protein n=1 Tax=Coprothermobacter platensis TaxID=108819 RepID=UPI0003684612|nr:HDOD domain-containing protein [Coprothermobacter platensis]